ncbi:MAG: hypothetical protein H7A05_04175 [Pseudomonadales bacterium]|nr:hypothetical protein [Pseudomonadales bacterium]MCP5329666.1 hypothetical protein [Pseudomonadales bacterium]MCP5343795.1 hypothetical protein [Pseudomonadales bacterium]
MLERWLITSNWTQEQWLVFSIIAFVVVAVIVIMFRLYAIARMATRKRERPNLRVARRLRRR